RVQQRSQIPYRSHAVAVEPGDLVLPLLRHFVELRELIVREAHACLDLRIMPPLRRRHHVQRCPTLARSESVTFRPGNGRPASATTRSARLLGVGRRTRSSKKDESKCSATFHVSSYARVP